MMRHREACRSSASILSGSPLLGCAQGTSGIGQLRARHRSARN